MNLLETKIISFYVMLILLSVVVRIDEENAATEERVSLTIHQDFMKEFISLECSRIVADVIR